MQGTRTCFLSTRYFENNPTIFHIYHHLPSFAHRYAFPTTFAPELAFWQHLLSFPFLKIIFLLLSSSHVFTILQGFSSGSNATIQTPLLADSILLDFQKQFCKLKRLQEIYFHFSPFSVHIACSRLISRCYLLHYSCYSGKHSILFFFHWDLSEKFPFV